MEIIKDATPIDESVKKILADPYLLNPSAFSEFLQDRLEILLLPVGVKVGTLTVNFECPSDEQIGRCLHSNRTLQAEIEISWSDSENKLIFPVPYPAHGVFIIRSDSSLNGRAGTWVWHPRLTGIPGLWLLRKHSYDKSGRKNTEFYHKFVLSNNLYLKISAGDYNAGTMKSILKSLDAYVSPCVINGSAFDFCSGLKDIDELLGPIFSFLKKGKAQFGVFDKVIDEAANQKLFGMLAGIFSEQVDSTNSCFDEQDIRWQRLYTYSAFLVNAILDRFLWAIKTTQKPKTIDPQEFWSRICSMKQDIVPVKGLREQGWLHYFNPLNGIDALSQLTSFQRYNYKSESLDVLPAIFRQNHDSYRGYVCPVETPESKRVGLSLRLARGVRVDPVGQLYSTDDSIDRDLGYAASLVPFYQHNDSPRSMMGAKNIKQAVPIKKIEAASVGTGHENEVELKIKPLLDSGIAPACSVVAPGTDLLIAYMPWYGWNMEDAIVANSRLVDDAILDWEEEEVFLQYVLPGFTPVEPLFENKFEDVFKTLNYGDDFLRVKGPITPSEPVVFFKEASSDHIFPLLCGGDEPGELTEISWNPPPLPCLGGSISWKIQRSTPLKVGDKLMGRYGNKGVVSVILPSDKLPKLPNDQRLPEELRGRAVDLVLNPHGVISRMNIGQLIETSAGMIQRLFPDELVLPADLGRGFQPVDHERMSTFLQQANPDGDPALFDKFGRIFLKLPGGEKTIAPVTVGYQYIVRLKHVADRKSQVRGWPSTNSRFPYSAVTGQPVGGRSRKGGQRLGEMEIWSLAALQMDKNLSSILSDKSDPATNLKKQKTNQTFLAIRDHLFAMGIEIKKKDSGNVVFDWINSENIKKIGQEATISDTWQTGVEGEFFCSNPKCDYCLPHRIHGTRDTQRGGEIFVTVSDVFLHYGYIFPPEGKQIYEIGPDGILTVKMEPGVSRINGVSRKNGRSFEFVCKSGKRDQHFSFKIGKDNFEAYMQTDSPKDTLYTKLQQCTISCAKKHHTTLLKARKSRIVPLPVKGGLCDEMIFGTPSVTQIDYPHNGYILLPEPIELSGKFSDKGKTINFGKPANPPKLKILPILPLKHRFRGPKRTGVVTVPQEEQLTGLYGELIDLVGSFSKKFESLSVELDSLNELVLTTCLFLFGPERGEISKRAENSYIKIIRSIIDTVIELFASASMNKISILSLNELGDVLSSVTSVIPCPKEKNSVVIEAVADFLQNLEKSVKNIPDKNDSNQVKKGSSKQTHQLAEKFIAICDIIYPVKRQNSWQNGEKTKELIKKTIIYISRHIQKEWHLRIIRDAVFKILLSIHDRLFDKKGLLRRKGLGRRVDASGRLVIAPDPNLAWDSCGVPTQTMITLLGPLIVQDNDIRTMLLEIVATILIDSVLGKDCSLPTKEVEEFILSEKFWTMSNDKQSTPAHRDLAYKVICLFLERHPEVTVILNRQPSLHRYSMMGLKPIPIHPEEGMVLKINPLVCKGFGADFDGDEMTIHMPLTSDEQSEAATLLPSLSQNIFSVADGKPMANFDQDLIVGHYYISFDESARKALLDILPDAECQLCQDFLNQPAPWKEGNGNDLLKHLCADHPDDIYRVIPEWMRLAFKMATLQGLSFGCLELVDLKDRFYKTTDEALSSVNWGGDKDQLTEFLAEFNDSLGTKILTELDNICNLSTHDPQVSGAGFAAMAVSGARGTKQTRQIISARGVLGPGNIAFDCAQDTFFFAESLVGGIPSQASFMAAMNGRSSMVDKKLGTGKAGGLTRKLVLASWDWVVKTGDCGVVRDEKLNLSSCKWASEHHCICSECYGSVKGYSDLPENYPAGLIAAQTIGERGTQLSMQSFHTAERQLSIDDILSLFGGVDLDWHKYHPAEPEDSVSNWFVEPEAAEACIRRIKDVNAYEKIDDRHLFLIWTIIHNSDDHTLESARNQNRSPFAGIIGPRQWSTLLKAIRDKWEEDFISPFAKVLMGQSPVLSRLVTESDEDNLVSKG